MTSYNEEQGHNRYCGGCPDCTPDAKQAATCPTCGSRDPRYDQVPGHDACTNAFHDQPVCTGCGKINPEELSGESGRELCHECWSGTPDFCGCGDPDCPVPASAHPVSTEGERAVTAFIEGFKAAGISQLSINGVRIYPPKTLAETHPHARVFRFEDDDV